MTQKDVVWLNSFCFVIITCILCDNGWKFVCFMLHVWHLASPIPSHISPPVTLSTSQVLKTSVETNTFKIVRFKIGYGIKDVSRKMADHFYMCFINSQLQFNIYHLIYNYGNSFATHHKGWPIRMMVRKAIAVIVYANLILGMQHNNLKWTKLGGNQYQ